MVFFGGDPLFLPETKRDTFRFWLQSKFHARKEIDQLLILVPRFQFAMPVIKKSIFHFQLRKHIIPAMVKASKQRDEESKGM